MNIKSLIPRFITTALVATLLNVSAFGQDKTPVTYDQGPSEKVQLTAVANVDADAENLAKTILGLETVSELQDQYEDIFNPLIDSLEVLGRTIPTYSNAEASINMGPMDENLGAGLLTITDKVSGEVLGSTAVDLIPEQYESKINPVVVVADADSLDSDSLDQEIVVADPIAVPTPTIEIVASYDSLDLSVLDALLGKPNEWRGESQALKAVLDSTLLRNSNNQYRFEGFKDVEGQDIAYITTRDGFNKDNLRWKNTAFALGIQGDDNAIKTLTQNMLSATYMGPDSTGLMVDLNSILIRRVGPEKRLTDVRYDYENFSKLKNINIQTGVKGALYTGTGHFLDHGNEIIPVGSMAFNLESGSVDVGSNILASDYVREQFENVYGSAKASQVFDSTVVPMLTDLRTQMSKFNEVINDSLVTDLEAAVLKALTIDQKTEAGQNLMIMQPEKYSGVVSLVDEYNARVDEINRKIQDEGSRGLLAWLPKFKMPNLKLVNFDPRTGHAFYAGAESDKTTWKGLGILSGLEVVNQEYNGMNVGYEFTGFVDLPVPTSSNLMNLGVEYFKGTRSIPTKTGGTEEMTVKGLDFTAGLESRVGKIFLLGAELGFNPTYVSGLSGGNIRSDWTGDLQLQLEAGIGGHGTNVKVLTQGQLASNDEDYGLEANLHIGNLFAEAQYVWMGEEETLGSERSIRTPFNDKFFENFGVNALGSATIGLQIKDKYFVGVRADYLNATTQVMRDFNGTLTPHSETKRNNSQLYLVFEFNK